MGTRFDWRNLGGRYGKGSYTEAMRVPGGMVIRSTTIPEYDREPASVSMVFVPCNASEFREFVRNELPEDGQAHLHRL